MPFRSEKQRRYLWKNHPKIARDWTDTYGSKPQPKKKAKGGSAVSKSGGITHKSQSGIGPSKKSQKKYYDKQRDAVREMNMSGRGKQLRYESFTDRKTGRLVPDTERNRKRYGKDRIYKSPEKITKIWKKGKPTYKAKGGMARRPKPDTKHNPHMEPYRGSNISRKVDGKMLSNPSLRKYYKGLI